MYKHIQSHKCDPPGTFREIVPHPGENGRVIEKAIIMEHRFAFLFWMKWKNVLQSKNWLHQNAPTLVTIDWHRDLAPPSPELKKELKKLDQSNLSDVANFVWARFDQTNDGHILCAAWLNLIGDVILLKNSASELRDTIVDMNGKNHGIFEFRKYERFENFLLQRNDQNIFFDIDLDYFIHGKGSVLYPESFERYSDEEIRAVINNDNPAFRQILSKIDGMTIAQEPSYCGGISNSCKIMDVINSQFFNNRNEWKHFDK